MKVHPRTLVVAQALNDLAKLVNIHMPVGTEYTVGYHMLAEAMLYVTSPETGVHSMAFVNQFTAMVESHGLTEAECASIVGAELSNLAKYAIRMERHPNEDKPGDVE